jgi:hypothetical protein
MFTKDVLRNKLQEKRLALKRKREIIVNSISSEQSTPTNDKMTPHEYLVQKYETERKRNVIKLNKFHRVDPTCQYVDIKAATALIKQYSDKSNDLITSQRQVLYNKIVHAPYSPVYLSPTHCHVCKTGLQRNSSSATRFCPNCLMVTQTIKDSISPIISKKTKRSISYNRCVLYRKYIMQFHVDAICIPREVLDTVAQKLFNIHILSRSKCRPTPIATILRETKHSTWVHHSVRISRLLNQQEPILFTQSIIDRLVRRCQLVERVTGKNGKFINFDFLTRQFLYMDQEHHLASLITSHKTKLVLERSENRLRAICDILQTSTFDDNDMPWFITYTPN